MDQWHKSSQNTACSSQGHKDNANYWGYDRLDYKNEWLLYPSAPPSPSIQLPATILQHKGLVIL